MALICRSSVLLVVAGVAIESFTTNQLLRNALSIYESSMAPKAKSRPGDITPILRVCPNAAPIVGRKPGNAIPY